METIRKILKYKRIWLTLAFPLGLVLTFIARLSPTAAEWYSLNIYPLFTGSIGRLVSLVPFSISELLALLTVITLVVYIIYTVAVISKRPAAYKGAIYRFGLSIISVACVLYLTFVLFMGINYYRRPITQYLDLHIKESTTQQLYELCDMLVEDAVKYRALLDENEAQTAVLSDSSRYETSQSAMQAYHLLSEQYPILKGPDIRNKPLVSSELFSHVLTTGIFVPFTLESNININVPEFTIPHTMCHELTHLRGFMREQEANFLGYLACMKSDRTDFKYSATLMAFGYAYSELHKDDRQLALKIADKCSDAILRDIDYENKYWDKYEDTAISNTSTVIYDNYLKANDQKDGTKSYGRMLDLMLAYFSS